MGCPKFNDVQSYIEKFANIFRTAEIKSVTTVVMEVLCCSGFPVIVNKGMEMANKNFSERNGAEHTRKNSEVFVKKFHKLGENGEIYFLNMHKRMVLGILS